MLIMNVIMRPIYLLFFVLCHVKICFGAQNEISVYVYSYTYYNNEPTFTYENSRNEIWVNENQQKRIKMVSSKYIYYSWCQNQNKTKKNLEPYYDRKGYSFYIDITGSDEFEGDWTCTFLRNQNIQYVSKDYIYVHSDGLNYLHSDSNIRILVKRSILLNIFGTVQYGPRNQEIKNFKQATVDETVPFAYKPGQVDYIKCERSINNDGMDRGKLVLQHCFSVEGEFYGQHKIKVECFKNEKFGVTMIEGSVNKTTKLLNTTCSFISYAGIASKAQINYSLLDYEPPIFEVNGVIAPDHTNGDYYYEATVGVEINLVCKNQENDGTVKWENCNYNKHYCYENNKSITKKITTNSTYSETCGYESLYGVKTATNIKIIVREPPKIIVNNVEVVGYNGHSYYECNIYDEIKVTCENKEKDGTTQLKYWDNSAWANGQFQKNTLTKSKSILHRCVYTSPFNMSLSKYLTIYVREYPTITVTGQDGKREENIDFYDGNIKEAIVVQCRNNEYDGSIELQFCQDTAANNCDVVYDYYESSTKTVTISKLAKSQNTQTLSITLNNFTTFSLVCEYKGQYNGQNIRKIIVSVRKPPTIKVIGSKITDVNGDYVYEGIVGDKSTIQCVNEEQNGQLNWEYCNDSTCKNEKTSYDPTISKVLDMTKVNSYNWNCVYTSPNGMPKNKKIVVYVLVPPKITVSVNGKTAKLQKDVFDGNIGDVMNISCNHKNTHGYLRWNDANTNDGQPTKLTDQSNINRHLELKEKHNKTMITCEYVSLNNKTLHSSIQLFVRSDPVAADGNFKISPTEAQFGEKVELKCHIDDKSERKFKITLKEAGEDGSNIILSGNYTKKNHYSAEYKMNVTHNVNVYCQVYDKTLTKKIQKTELEIKFMDTPENVLPLSGKTTLTNETDISNNSNIPNEQYYMYGVIGGALTIIFILVFAIYKVCKRPVEKKRTSVTYENLNNEHPGTTPPFPRGAKLEETYLCPADCQETPYATAGVPEDTYALPYKAKMEDLYSKPLAKKDRIDKNALYTQVLPKNQRNNQTTDYISSKSINELNYAEIQPNKIDLTKNYEHDSESNYAVITNDNYSNIAKEALNVKHRRDEKQIEDYTNVFTNEQYCNSKDGKSDDYAEPSYCQVNRK